MLNKILNSQTKTITQGALIVGFFSLLSRILGLVRDGLISGTFGTSPQADIYFSAFKIPDFIYNFLIAGGLSVVFLPILSEYMNKSKEEAWKMINNTINVILAVLFVFAVICFIFTPQLLQIIVPGFNQEMINEAVSLTRLLLLSPIFFGISSLVSSTLMYFNRFLSYSLAPVVYNICIILGIKFLAPSFGIMGVGMGVIVGAVCHLLIQMPAFIHCGYKFQPLFDFKAQSIKDFFVLALPRTVAVAGQQINDVVTTGIASTLTTGSIAVFNYANNIQYMPIGFFAVPFSIAAFPMLSKFWAQSQSKEFFDNLSSTIKQVVFLVLPTAMAIFVLRAPIVRIILGSLGKNFSWADTRITAACVGMFSVDLLGAALIPLLARAFFAIKNTKTPTVISLISIGLNITLSFLFVNILQQANGFREFLTDFLDIADLSNVAVVGLPLAYSVSFIFQALFLLWFLYCEIGDFGMKNIFKSFLKTVLASTLAAISIYWGLYFFAGIFNHATVLGLIAQTFCAGITGVIVYFLSAYFLKMEELGKLLRLLPFRRNGN